LSRRASLTEDCNRHDERKVNEKELGLLVTSENFEKNEHSPGNHQDWSLKYTGS
jgi:hypothetical protein